MTLVEVDTSSGCWLWRGRINDGGYGTYGSRLAHREIFLLYGGEIEDGLELDHLCRVRCCVNPAHLEAVTRQTNVLRGEGPAGVNARKTHCPKDHPYSEENTYITVRGKRRCRICQGAANKKSRAKLRSKLCVQPDIYEAGMRFRDNDVRNDGRIIVLLEATRTKSGLPAWRAYNERTGRKTVIRLDRLGNASSTGYTRLGG